MKRLLKMIGIALLIAIAVFVFTNPTVKDFKEYIGITTQEEKDFVFRKTANWLIFSRFKTDMPGYNIEYIGFFQNFFPRYEF